MKKIFLIISLCIFLNSFSTVTFSADAYDEADLIDKFYEQIDSSQIEEEQPIEEQKLYTTATIDDAFTESDILVVLSKEQSALQQEYSVYLRKYFPVN